VTITTPNHVSRSDLLKLLREIPLGEAEQAAVEDGIAAYENLLSKLADVPTPAGPTPHQIGAELVQITSFRQVARDEDSARSGYGFLFREGIADLILDDLTLDDLT
jgi:hypothetical protein